MKVLAHISFFVVALWLTACAHTDASDRPSPSSATLFHAGTAAEVVTKRSSRSDEDGCAAQWIRVERLSPTGKRRHRKIRFRRCGEVVFEMTELYDESGRLVSRELVDDSDDAFAGRSR